MRPRVPEDREDRPELSSPGSALSSQLRALAAGPSCAGKSLGELGCTLPAPSIRPVVLLELPIQQERHAHCQRGEIKGHTGGAVNGQVTDVQLGPLANGAQEKPPLPVLISLDLFLAVCLSFLTCR